MKEYKLIKTYPGESEMGRICCQNYSKYPEFWEEVKEKTFEILSFRYLRKDAEIPFGEIRTLGVNTVCSAEQYLNIGSSVKNGDWAIHSVKRLCDRQVFSIGDKIKVKYKDGISEASGIIGKFQINTKLGLLVHYDLGTAFIENIEQPIFTTLDNEEVFEGDIFYCVDRQFKVIERQITNDKWSKDFIKIDSIFAKKENAEEFIKQNEKRFSLNDIKETVKKLNCFGSTLIEYLEKSVS